MPSLKPGKFSSPELLRKFRPDLLRDWLAPFADYFTRRGFTLPPRGADASPDYDRLARILIEPVADMPEALLESLYLFRELDNPLAMDAIHAEAHRRGLDLQLDSHATPLDMVVRAWTLDRRLVEGLHTRLELKRPRAFKIFTSDALPLPAFTGPTPEQLQDLEARLNHFYEAWKRGKGARVFPSRQGDQWLFLVRHGAPCRRENAMQNDEPTTVFYRPQKHDVLKYDAARGELAVNCCSDRERRILLRLFGACLFGRGDFFPGAARYTLAPLVHRGRACLACADVPGIERVSLTEVELEVQDDPRHRDIRKAEDIFALVETGKLVWPQNVDEIRRATFAIKFWRAPRPRRLTIMPCNRVVYGREEDSGILERLLRTRGFIDAEETSVAA